MQTGVGGGGLLALRNMHPSVRSEAILCPRPRAPATRRRSGRSGAPRPGPGPADTRLSAQRTLAKRATLRPALLRASVLGTYHGRAAHKSEVHGVRLTDNGTAEHELVSGIESGETQYTRTQHSLVCAQLVDSQSQCLAHAPMVPPYERHRGTQCHGCRPPK